MPRNVTVGLIQCATPFDPNWSVEKIKSAALEKHLPMIEEAGKKGVQILGLQEIFNGPYFCPSQDTKWYDAAEPCPGPTVERMQAYAKKRIKELGLNGSGKVRINKAGCMDRCDEGPVMVVYPEEVWYTYVDKHDIDEIIDEHLVNGRVVERLRI